MAVENGFHLFGPAHLGILVVLAVAGAALVYGTRRWASAETTRWIGVATGVFMIVQELVDRLCHHFLNGEPFTETLPFHLCGASVVLAAIMFITRNRTLHEILYFWGWTGASMALLTPDIKSGFPHLLFFTYFISHALIIVGVVYMTVNYGYRPTLRSVWRVFLLTNAYMLIVVVPVDLVLGANYLFLCHKPDAHTLFDYMGPWPWYILIMEPVAFLMFAAVYCPYLVRDYFRRERRERISGTTQA